VKLGDRVLWDKRKRSDDRFPTDQEVLRQLAAQ
jgi:hypothetical protein